MRSSGTRSLVSHISISSLTVSSPTAKKWMCMFVLCLLFICVVAWDFSNLRLQQRNPRPSSFSLPSSSFSSSSSSLSHQKSILVRLLSHFSSMLHSSSLDGIHTSQPLSKHSEIQSTTRANERPILNDSMVHFLTTHHKELKYIPSINTLLYTSGKGGSTTVLRHVYTGLTGERWADKGCKRYIQDPKNACWKGLIYGLNMLPLVE